MKNSSSRVFVFLVTTALVWSFVSSPAPAEVENTPSDLRRSIQDYMWSKIKDKEHCAMRDLRSELVRKLEFLEIHKGVHRVKDRSYFACADFSDSQNNTFDLDFFVRKGEDILEVDEVVLR